jgi:TP901 family phage tail tape measure protein
MANLKTEVILSMNGKAAIQVLEALRDKARSVREEIDHLDKDAPDFKERKAGLESVYKTLQNYQTNIIKDTERLDHALKDLSTTSLQNLRKALGDGRRQLQKLSEDDLAQAEEVRKKMKQVGDEIRLIEGQYVKIADGLKNVSNQSDQWLDKAIKQQRDLVGSLEKSDAGYQQNLATLKRLEAEEDRRKGKMNVAEARQTVSDDNASASDLRRAKAALTEARDKTAIGKTGEIDSYNRDLQEIEKRLETVSGKTQKASMSWKQMKQVLAEPNKASGEDIKRTMEVIQQKIQQLPAGSKYVADLRRQYAMLEQTLKGTRMSQSALNDILTRSKQGKASIDELRRAYKQLEEELNQLNTKSKEFADKQKSMKELKENIDEVTGATNKQGGAWHTALKNLTAYVGLFSVFNHIKDLVTGAIKKNFEYSGSLTDIRKVSGLTMEQVKQLSTELAKIDTRTSVDGLAQLAYEASKLGVGKYGVEGMAQFVRAADKINVAIGEEMGEKALPSLLKMTEVMGLIPKMGLERSIEAVGSSMFKLASTSTATSSDITEFVKRCTGVARTAGITTDQLLALGSAFSAQMASPEVAATAMSKFIVALQKNHNLIEKDLAIPAGTINSMYQAGNAMDAIVLILEKMKEKGNMNALGEIFKDVGGDGQRLISSMVTMAKNVDMLKDHLYESQEAFEEATAVGKEYSMQQQSAIGILERANNLWEKAFVNPDGVDAVKGMAEWWYEMSATMTSSPLLKGTLQIALQMVLITLKAVATLLPVIIGYMASQGLYSGLSLLWQYLTALGVAVKSMFQYARALFTANAAQSTLNKTMKLNPWIAFASVIIGVAGAIYGYTQRAREAAEAAKEAEKQANAWKSTLGKAAVETANLNKKLENYKRMMSESNLSQKERQGLISRFNKDFRSYISNLGIEIKSVKDLRDHYSELAQEAQRATYYRMMEKAKQQALPKLDADRDSAANALLAQVQKLGIDKLGVSFADIDRWVSKGANGNALFWNLVKKMPKNKSGLQDGFNWKLGKDGYIYRDTYDGGKAGINSDDSQMQYELRDLLSASRWYANATGRRRKKEKDIEDNYQKWFPKGYTPYPEEDPGTLEKDAPDKDAIAQEKRDKRDRERAWREELKQKQDQAKAIMDDVDNYYDRQINAKLAQAISLNMDKTEQEQFVLPLRQNKEIARSQVRLAVAGKPNKWEDAKKMMAADMVEQKDETGINLSKDLLDGILKNNIDNLRKLMEQLGKNLGLSMNSITAEILAKATRSEQEILKMKLKQMEARRKIVMEHDYTGIVQQNSYDSFNEMGYAAPTKEETTVTKKMVDGKEVLDTSAFDKRRKAIKDMYETARKELAQLYAIDVSTTNGRGVLMKILFGDDPDGMAARIKASLGESEESWKSFYLNLIQYSDNYAEAEKKKYDSAKKIVDFWWSSNKRNLAQQDKLRKMQNESNLFGKRTNLLSNLGLANLTADPEIELMKARMQAAEDYYAFVERNTKNKQLIDEAERARQEAELAYANQMATAMKSRLSQMKELVQPIEDFGAAVGQALAEMRYDAESANDAIKSALKSMLESWAKMALNDVNTQMWKAINDAGAKRGKKKAQPDIDAARANAKANYTDLNGIDWRNFGTESNPLWVRWAGDHYENKSGDAVYTKEDGTPLPNPNGSVPQSNEPPSAWKKRHPDGTIDDYNKEVKSLGGQVGTSMAGQTGASVAGAVTGSSSFGDAATGIAMSGADALLNAQIKKTSKSEKEREKQLEKEKKHQKDLTKETKKGLSDREKATGKGVKNITSTTEQGNKEQSKGTVVAQQTITNATEAGLNATLTAKQKNNDETLKSDANRTQGEVTFSIAGAMAKCFEFLGPIAGPIAAAVVMSTLMGLLQWALNSALGGGKKKNSTKGPNTKVVSGMLTYDSGNVQDLRPFVGNDGSLYWAAEDSNPHNGVSLLTRPTATSINGHPSLVAEKGPELVIGRETTQAMMMNNPQLLKALVNYDRNYSGRHAYDAGNISETSPTIAAESSVTDEMVSNQATTNIALLQAVNTLLQRLEQPIEAKIDMYGRGKLYDSMTKANQFMKNK